MSPPIRIWAAVVTMAFCAPGHTLFGQDRSGEEFWILDNFGKAGVSKDDVPQPWRNEDENRFIHIEADFNGDGIREFVYLVWGFADPALDLDVISYDPDSDEPPGFVSLTHRPKGELPFLGIHLVEPGIHKTACGNGYRPCRDDEPEAVELTRPGIAFFKHEGWKTIFYWDSDAESYLQFEVIP